MSVKSHRWWSLGAALMALLSVQFVTPSAQAAACYSTTFTPVCACPGCGYIVFCGFKAGTTTVLDFAYCNGNNPGFLVTGTVSSTRGLTSSACYTSTCGTATLTGICCGGARSTTADWSLYQTCTPAGGPCSPGGTGG